MERTTSNAFASAGAPSGGGAGASRETLRALGRLGSDGAGGRGAAAGAAEAAAVGGNCGRSKRGKLAAGRGGGRSGSTLLPSTNMQLSNAFHVSTYVNGGGGGRKPDVTRVLEKDVAIG